MIRPVPVEEVLFCNSTSLPMILHSRHISAKARVNLPNGPQNSVLKAWQVIAWRAIHVISSWWTKKSRSAIDHAHACSHTHALA
jgi:hypothetical protein